MRGKAVTGIWLQLIPGITPAYAGKSSCHKKEARGSRDHPRLCGEKFCNNQFGSPIQGSPPPMRGKVTEVEDENGYKRITPAYAGKSCRKQSADLRYWDHPRLCGEKLALAGQFAGKVGSPPPMRGKVASERVAMPSSGITPAYAGKSSRLPFIPTSFQDHPRLCGEKHLTCDGVAGVYGSPPPMRGKGKKANCSYSVYRITPAYAGKRMSRLVKRCLC